MTQKELEQEALQLEPRERADLAARLLESLDDVSADEWAQLWSDEVARRDAEMDSGTVGDPADDVFRNLQAKLAGRG